MSGSPRSLYPSPRPPTSLSAGLGPALPSRPGLWAGLQVLRGLRIRTAAVRPPRGRTSQGGTEDCESGPSQSLRPSERGRLRQPVVPASATYMRPGFRGPPRGSCLRRRLRPAADSELQAGPAPAGPALGPGQRAPPPATSRLGQKGGRRALTGNFAAAPLSAPSLSEYSFEKSCWVWPRPAPPPPTASFGLLPSSRLSSSGAASLTASMLPVWRGYWLIICELQDAGPCTRRILSLAGDRTDGQRARNKG